MNVIFIHVATINNYNNILQEFIQRIIVSKLIDYVQQIFICISGNDVKLNLPPKFTIISNNCDINKFEFPTLEKIKSFTNKNPNSNVLYLHTKGVSDPENLAIIDWRNYMSYFVINKFQDCLKALENNFTCGVDLRLDPCLHYSGNFWWSKGSHINNLSNFEDMPIILSERHKAEFWICSTGLNHYCLWDSGINQYERHLHRYSAEKYELS